MRVIDVVNAPWAIVPEKLEEIRGIYETHLKGEKIDIAAVEARLGAKLTNEPPPYDVVDGVAIVPMVGVMAKRMNLFSQISGGASTQLVARDLQQARNDPAVQAIILSIDSPGGTVDGTQELAQLVRAIAQEKPVVTLADGVMASAAYWVGSAASEVLINGDTTMVGSIGVVATHVDVSNAEQQRGVKTTEIVAGKYKRIASSYGPLTEDGRKSMQDQVDYLYGVFVDQVAQHRGVDAEKVQKDMADGRVFIGQQAVAAGLVDGVSTMSALIADLAAGRRGTKPNMGAGAAPKNATSTTKGPTTMDKATIEKDHPAIAEALRAEGFAAGRTEGLTVGAKAERERIQNVEAQALPGHEKLIGALKFDGKTTGPEAAAAVLAAEKSQRQAAAASLPGDAPAAVPAAAADNADANKPAASTMDAEAIAAEATKIVAENAAKGISVSTTEAVKQVTARLKAAAK